ncbi:MAG: hypothetical protein HY721_34315, partial [Planctomycetes bacterium]|nr:hypothetical protein [Planctomycetota bacterium]
MTRLLGRALAALGVDRRSFECLAGTFVLMDLRGQHFARATGARHRHRITPLFWVVGQCLTLSAVASLVLFARVDVFFFSFASLSLSLLVTATAVLVELHEVVLDPRDLEVIGHRPVSPRTYAAARLANLLFYVALMYLALNTFPLVLGAGLRDAGPWYLPAYAIASLAGTLIAVGLLILLLPLGDSPAGLEQLKEILAWVQIVLILVVGYGAQLIFRDGTQSFLVWAAFPPRWVDWTPPAWLARFVEAAATEPGPRAIGAAGILATLTVLVVAAALRRLARLYGRLEPARRGRAPRPMPAERVGGLAGPVAARLLRSPAERAGFWLAGRLLAREGELKVR